MIPKSIMQTAMDEISRRFHCSLAGYDLGGNLVAGSGEGARGLSAETVRQFARSKRTRGRAEGVTLLKICSLSEPFLIAAVHTAKDRTAVEVSDLVFALLALHQRARFETEEFYRRLFSGTISPSDMAGCVCELGLDRPCRRVVYVVSFGESRGMVLADRLCAELSSKLRDHVMTLRRSRVLVICEIPESVTEAEQTRRELERTLVQTIQSLTELPARIGCGCCADEIGELRRSYEEAVAAIETGRMFSLEGTVHRYDELLFEHLVSHLPRTFCRWFLNRGFSDSFFDDLDEEMARTATVFLDNTMNAAETSRQLFFHRNTLRYRLTSIQGRSGLDLRNFRDAQIFRLGMAIHRYVRSFETGDNEEHGK